MNYSFPIEEMTTAEKLNLMERLWDELCRNAEDVPSPAWHAPILRERETRYQQGEEAVLDWEDAKRSIRESIK